MRLPNRRSGTIGSAARRSTATNATSAATAEHERDHDVGAGPARRRGRPRRTPSSSPETPAAKSAEPGVVDDRAPRRRAARSRRRGGDERHRHRAERQVDVEDPAPRHVIGEQAADQRARPARRRPTRPRCSPASCARRSSPNSSPMIVMPIVISEPAPRPCTMRKTMSCGHVLRQPGQRGADQEDREAGQEDAAAAEADRTGVPTAASSPSEVSRKPEKTHEYISRPPRLATTVGIAVETTVDSIARRGRSTA